MEQLANYVANLLGKRGIVQQDDIQTCRYGLEVFLSTVLEFLSIILFAFIVGNFLETLLFFIALMPLRIYAGGYHADTRLRCYGILVVSYVIFSILLKSIPAQAYTVITGVSMLFTFIVVVGFAPIVSHHKNVSQPERVHYRKISITIVSLEIVIILLSILLFENNIYIFSFALGQVSVALAMLAALIKDKLKGGSKYETC